MANENIDEKSKKRVQLEDLKDGEEISGSIFPLNPDKGISTVRVAGINRVLKFNPVAEGTIMCGW